MNGGNGVKSGDGDRIKRAAGVVQVAVFLSGLVRMAFGWQGQII